MFEMDSVGAITIYAIALMVSIVACILLAILIWDRRPVRGTLWLAFFMLAMAIWSTAYLLEILSPTIPGKYLFSNITFFSKATMPVIWLAFALKYTGQEELVTPKNLALFLIIPIITIIAVWTNGFHGLIWSKIEVDYSNTIDILTRTHGILFWFTGVYFCAMMLIGTGIIARNSIITKTLNGKIIAVIVGISLPLLVKVITVFKPDIFNNLDMTPIVFTICWCGVCWYAFREKVIDVIPMARDTLIEQMTDGMIVVDNDGYVLYHNHAVRDIAHRAKSTILGKPITQILPGLSNLAEIAGSNKIIELENGTHRFFAVQVLFLQKRDNIPAGYLISLHEITEKKIAEEQLKQYKKHLEDLVEERTVALTKLNAQLNAEITEHKQAKEALSASEAKYRSLIETAVAGVCIIDTNGKVIFVNKAICHMLGYSREELQQKHFASFIYPDDLSTYINISQNFDSQPETKIDLEFRVVCKDKSIIWIRTNPSPVIVKGQSIGFSAILHNTTDHKKAETELKKSYDMLQKSLKGTVNAVAKMVELRDPYTAGHQLRVSKLSIAIAREMNLLAEQIDYIGIAAAIHDVGKVYIPSEILSKPVKLSDFEFGIVMTHPQGSYDILKNIEFPWPIAQIALQHHERMDGSGYPQGLKGENIIFEARILAVADVVEAMVSHRPYRPAVGIVKAMEEITLNKGKLYDTEVVEACRRVFTEKSFKFEKLK